MTQMCLYHEVPGELHGDHLYPLNRLRQLHPSIYDAQSLRYAGEREYIPKQRIDCLDCTWGDVIFLSAIPPARFMRALRSVGIPITKRWHAFAINQESIDCASTVIMKPMEYVLDAPEYVPFTAENLSLCTVIPPATLAHYRDSFRERTKLYLHSGVGQILTRDPIDVRGLTVVASH